MKFKYITREQFRYKLLPYEHPTTINTTDNFNVASNTSRTAIEHDITLFEHYILYSFLQP